MKYTCPACGEDHEDWPALAFSSPCPYNELSDEEKETIAELSDDFCVIRHEDQTDRFIRAVLFQSVNDHCEDLHYGVWVSLSEKSFNDYKDHFQDNEHEAVYFGYLSNRIAGYEETLSVETNVVLSKGGNRPEVMPHDNQMANTFVKDYYSGITRSEAERRIKAALG